MKQMSDVDTTMSSRPPRPPLPIGFPHRRCDQTGFAFTIRGLMLQGTPGRRVSEFYDHHPISEAGVLAALALRRRGDPALPTVDDPFEFDQDHYGCLAAVDALPRRAVVACGPRVPHVGPVLGGPA